jgi:hypothetical protein
VATKTKSRPELAPTDLVTLTREQAMEAVAWLYAADEVLISLNDDRETPLSDPFGQAAWDLYDAVFKPEHPFDASTLEGEKESFAWPMRVEMFARGYEHAADTLCKLKKPHHFDESLLYYLYGTRRLHARAKELRSYGDRIRKTGRIQ